MDGRSNRGTTERRSRVVTAGLTLGVLVGLIAGPARASAILGSNLIAVTDVSSLGPAWEQFLLGGPALWALESPPPFPSGLVLPTSNGQLVDTPFVNYLEWRRSLDPSRFDLNHPNIATELGQFVPTSTSVPGSTSSGGGTTHVFNPTPQNLPEPGTFWIAVTLIGAGLATRLRISIRAASAHQ